ncbi:hypothetical protein BBJ28_00017852 [Nothophytophthora sp. Chile5]|nr:hypothetical protein BBJ28_00017852 [Nothophytophthora sp. Chile5]
MEPQNPTDLAKRVHADGFVALPVAPYAAPEELVALVRAQVLRRYERFLAEAAAQRLDLTLREHSERLPGFYVREGGRVDMQLSTSAFQTRPVTTFSLEPVDLTPLQVMAASWQPVLTELFAPAAFQLEYVGCVLSRPGDSDQNWHLDGVHRHPNVQELADRVNVFVPLVAINQHTGGTEMKIRSHIRKNGARGSAFEDYSDAPSITECVSAGTPIVMDYRVWHRGLANASEDVIRPLLYFKYAKIQAVDQQTTEKKATKKRITPMLV